MLKVKLYHVLVLFTLLCCVVSTAKMVAPNSDQYQLMQRTSILFGLTVISRPDMVSQNCYTQLQEVQKAMLMQQPWAMKMFDASGVREPGFTMGNGIWVGSRDTCNAVKTPVNLKLSTHVPHKMNPKILTDTAPFPTDYRVVNLWHNSTWQMDPVYIYYEPRISIGLCLPSACTVAEISQLMAAYVEDELFVSNDVYDMRMRVEGVKDLKLRTGFYSRPSLLVFIGCWLLTLLLTFLALWQRMKRNIETAEVVANGTNSTNDHLKTTSHKSTQSFYNKFIVCFDVQNNWELLFPKDASAAPIGTEAFPAVNGLRFYGAMVVVLFHLLCCSYLASSNKAAHYKLTSDIGNFDIFVDLFFTMSGFLQTYHFFRNTKTIKTMRRGGFMKNAKTVFTYILHRLIRLGPLYFISICLADAGWLLMDDISVFHFSHKLYANCEQYWWRSALFIQNFFKHDDLCLFWTWSSACDMQFYIFSTILLFIYVKHPRAGKALTLATVVANLIYSSYIGITMNYMYSFETTVALFTELYMNSLSRVLAYVIGGLAGWFFVQNQKRQLYANFFQNQSLQEYLGCSAIICFFTINFANISEGYSVGFYVAMLIVQRVIFSSSVCLLIFANAAGSVKWFFGLLENPLFKKFNQITYAMFLLHPVPMGLLASLNNIGRYSSPYNLAIDYISVCTILFFFSTIFSLFFEVPYKNISKMLVQPTKPKTN
ncbi:PREDICTED: nose resistant to fluoxetine protein 6-like [Bactrocera latifrons]|uniref:nose resistant to fluoxetine protein 6-like n=1 Tax=Bactrocera latifrons TaxID=174628 RepID=UPI0008DCC0E2|nr:PREDICTED: nose resistant to fluoxetine protein 6-like [Bactrocera latifrons]